MPGFQGQPLQYAPSDYIAPPVHGKTFTSFGARVDLTNQTQTNLDAAVVDLPQCAASEVTMTAGSDAATFNMEIGKRLPMVYVVATGASLTIRGAFTGITSVTGTAPRVNATWHQAG